MYFSESSDFNFYTDLASERCRADIHFDGVSFKKEDCAVGLWEHVEITTKEGAESIGRPIGFYDTLSLERFDLLDGRSISLAKDEISIAIKKMLGKMNVSAQRVLVVGLGNASLTPDSLGPASAALVKPTLHVSITDPYTFKLLECAEIAVIAPGVCTQSGFDSCEAVKAICDRLLPDAVIAVDSLAAKAPERLGATVQLSSSGITPGSGLGRKRLAVDEDSLGIPVISVGVPTVMDSKYFLNDDIRRAYGRSAMMISPKEIDEIVSVGADIISGGINRAFGFE